jgi:hypothetical protein
MKENKLDNIWDNINSDLELKYQETNREALIKAIHQLPFNKAPDRIWNEMEANIHKQKIKFLTPYRLKIAASVIGLLGIGLGLLFWNSNEKVNYYSEQKPESIDLTSISDTTNSSFEKLKNATCQIKPGVCNSTEFKTITHDYSDLIQYQNKILQQSKISDDENLQAMLIKIEEQKKQIQQQMIAMID